jgi:hypothetical protein
MKFNIPDENAPGFFRRQKKLQAFLNEPKNTDLMIDWLADFVVADNREQAIEMLLDASEKEIDELNEAIAAASGPDPKASANSGDG